MVGLGDLFTDKGEVLEGGHEAGVDCRRWGVEVHDGRHGAPDGRDGCPHGWIGYVETRRLRIGGLRELHFPAE